MYLDLTVPLYTLLALDVLLVILGSVAAFFVLRKAFRGLKALLLLHGRNKGASASRGPGPARLSPLSGGAGG